MIAIRRRALDVPGTRGFTLLELLIVVAIVGVVAVAAVPGLLRARMSADEASAIGSLRTISSAQAGYVASAGSGGYASTLAALGSSCAAGSQPFISPDLASDPSAKSGYQIALAGATGLPPVGVDCNGIATHGDFYSTAAPFAPGVSGRLAFASNSGGSIYFDTSGVPPTEAAMVPGGGGQVLR